VIGFAHRSLHEGESLVAGLLATNGQFSVERISYQFSVSMFLIG